MAQAATWSEGTIALTGDWEDKTIQRLNTVLRRLQNVREHTYWNDLHIEGKFSLETKKLPFSAKGGWSFDFTLQLLNEFIAEQVAAGRRLSGKTCHALLTAMEEKGLMLVLNFTLYSNWGITRIEDEVEYDDECGESYRNRDEKHIILSAKDGAWAMNHKSFIHFPHRLSLDCDMEWLIVFHVFVDEYAENKLTPMQLAQLRQICLQWAKQNKLYLEIDVDVEYISWYPDGNVLYIDEEALKDYAWMSPENRLYHNNPNEARLVECIRADLQPTVDIILKNRQI